MIASPRKMCVPGVHAYAGVGMSAITTIATRAIARTRIPAQPADRSRRPTAMAVGRSRAPSAVRPRLVRFRGVAAACATPSAGRASRTLPSSRSTPSRDAGSPPTAPAPLRRESDPTDLRHVGEPIAPRGDPGLPRHVPPTPRREARPPTPARSVVAPTDHGGGAGWLRRPGLRRAGLR